MKPSELKDYILKHMSAEEALEKLLTNVCTQYEEIIKVGSYTKKMEGDSINPIFIISAAAMELGWQFVISKDPNVNGLIIGTKEYIDNLNLFTKQ